MSSRSFNDSMRQVGRRSRQVAKILSSEGYGGISSRVRKVVAERMMPRDMQWEVLPADVLAANLSTPPHFPAHRAKAGEPISVNWVIPPAEAGSGGHTTIYRMVRYLAAHGFKNTVYFYNVYGGDQKYYADIVSQAYGVDCDVRDLADGMDDADAVVATSWCTAYPVYAARSAGKRFYFVQDYEPHFYPVGANSMLAENTYRMGFYGITAGSWLAKKLSEDFGMQAGYFPFGCDTERYVRSNDGKRNGIAFYARASTPRRGVEIGLLALEIFAKKNPGIDIHLYGGRFENLPFKFINHGLVSPSQLNEIYNQCFAGLSLSLTNVSLVPHEMLAAGCIPVVNDAEHNRMVLDNDHIKYAPPTPHELAAALEEVVTMPDFAAASAAASKSVASASWDEAGVAVAKILELARAPELVHNTRAR